MSGEDINNGNEALEKSISLLETLKGKFPNVKIISYVIAFLAAGGGGTFLWAWDKTQEHIIKVSTPKIIHLSDSIAKVKIAHALDSISQRRRMRGSLGDQLSSTMLVSRDSVPYKIGDWYNNEKNIFQIGLFGNKQNGKILYRHVNGEVYRAIFKPDRDYYYYFDDNGQWKQVK